ncbi:FERM PH-like domain protein [Ostertagia ostertagi]
MQLQRDLLHGRLYCPQNQSAELAALILQEGEPSRYLWLRSIYTVKDPKDPSHAVYLGVSHKGILIYHANQKVHHIPWSYLSKVDYIGKEVYIYPMDAYVPPNCSGDIEDNNDKKHKDRKPRLVLKYHCPSGTFAKHLWNHILSQQAFFNEQSALMIKPKFSKPRIPLLSRGSTFRYPSRRVLREIENTDIASDSEVTANGPAFVRFELPRQEPRKEQPWLNKYNTLPNMKLNHNNNEISKRDENMDEKVATVISATTVDAPATDVDAAVSVPQSVATPSSIADETINRQSTVSVATTQDSADKRNENVTSFTVRLVKYERSPTVSPEPDESKEDTVLRDKPGIPVIGSPSSSSSEERVVNRTATATARNGAVQRTDDVTQRSSGRCANVFFSTFLILLLLLATSIAVFERSGDSNWMENTAWLSHVRHSYYEPVRHVILDKYHKYFVR